MESAEMNAYVEYDTEPPSKACEWCGSAFECRDDERPALFARRKTCSVECSVASGAAGSSAYWTKRRMHAMGDIYGPFPARAERGVLTQVGRKVICHICGLPWVALGVHVNQRHGLTADQYRREFGLRSTCGLVSEWYHDRLVITNGRRIGALAHEQGCSDEDKARLSSQRSKPKTSVLCPHCQTPFDRIVGRVSPKTCRSKECVAMEISRRHTGKRLSGSHVQFIKRMARIRAPRTYPTSTFKALNDAEAVAAAAWRSTIFGSDTSAIWTPRLLAAAKGCTEKQASGLISGLLKSGFLKRVKRGQYMVVNAGI